jgi:hypothetical protein
MIWSSNHFSASLSDAGYSMLTKFDVYVLIRDENMWYAIADFFGRVHDSSSYMYR